MSNAMPLDGADKRSLARRRRRDSRVKSTLERQIARVDAILIGLTIAAVAYADWSTGPTLSFGFLYLIPLSYSALSQKRWTTIVLLALCVGLRQWLSPLDQSTTAHVVRDWVLTGAFVSVVAVLGSLGRRRARFFESARQQRDELLKEVEMAVEVQNALIHRNSTPETPLDIDARMRPAKVVGGDYFGFLDLPDGALGVVVADVAGKGLAAAMLMPAVDIALRAIAQRTVAPAETLRELNEVLSQNTGRSNYATVFYGVLDPKTSLLQYANGGHLPGLLLKQDGRIERLVTGGTPIGLLPSADFESGSAQFSGGDVLVLYSDGITEAENVDGEQFGEERLAHEVNRVRQDSAAEIADAVEQAVARFRSGVIAGDDATVIVLKHPLVEADKPLLAKGAHQ